ncbi:MAG: sulfatase/phosphatase domain-containing protein, partial [Alphaproteobacteria bacterium]
VSSPTSVKVPLIIYDPSPEADATRGTVCDALVESIDLAPTFVEMAGGTPRDEHLEGLSLVPFLHGKAPDSWRDFVVSEYDYSMTAMAAKMGVTPKDARLFMAFDGRWKLMHAEGGMPPMLFDLENDPNELVDLGRDPAYEEQRRACYEILGEWSRRCAQRNTISDDEIVSRRGRSRRKGIVLGMADPAAADPELTVKYSGKTKQRFV